jgi:hypothetical protein
MAVGYKAITEDTQRMEKFMMVIQQFNRYANDFKKHWPSN